jgi:hypothetical protein
VTDMGITRAVSTGMQNAVDTKGTPMANARSHFRVAPVQAWKPFGGTFGALAIAVGVGVLGAYMLDLHGHTCVQCGRRWRHFGAFNFGDEQSHTCTCGQVQWWKCGMPHVLHGSQFASPAPERQIDAQGSQFAAPAPARSVDARTPLPLGLVSPVVSEAPRYTSPLLAIQTRRLSR